jgi:RNA polymerase sigma factor (sigma-70 family)
MGTRLSFAFSRTNEMARGSTISSEEFEETLAWLDSDREMAAVAYIELRRDLEKLFHWRQCSDWEELADEVFDRVAKKVHKLQGSYEGNPRFYFYAVANNLLKEHFKSLKSHVSIAGLDLWEEDTIVDESKEKLHRILEECVQELSPRDRRMILEYYQASPAKKRDGEKLAARFGISYGALRVKIYRIREKLRRNILRKMKMT